MGAGKPGNGWYPVLGGSAVTRTETAGRHLDLEAVVQLLAKALRDTASLPGAACQGDARFTSDVAADQAAALRICARCPELVACRRWVESLPRSRIPVGVTAGQIHQPRPPGRPKKGTTA